MKKNATLNEDIVVEGVTPPIKEAEAHEVEDLYRQNLKTASYGLPTQPGLNETFYFATKREPFVQGKVVVRGIVTVKQKVVDPVDILNSPDEKTHL